MSSFHVPAKQPHPFFHGLSTQLGKRALKWLGSSFGLFVAVIATSMITESITGGGVEHRGLSWGIFDAVWGLTLLAAGALAAASMVASIIAIFRRGERSWIAFATILPALLLFLLFAHPLFIND